MDDLSFDIDENFLVDYHINGKTALLKIEDKRRMISMEIHPQEFIPVSTLHYSETEEDVNFGVWIFNVLSSTERRKILQDNW